MTTCYISEMEAGRELDALVAEKVLNCKVFRYESNPSEPCCGCDPGRSNEHAVDGGLAPIPLKHYSTNIAAAWEVVEKMKDKGWASIILNGIAEGHTIVRFYNALEKEYLAQGKDAPHAICKAALAAIGGSHGKDFSKSVE